MDKSSSNVTDVSIAACAIVILHFNTWQIDGRQIFHLRQENRLSIWFESVRISKVIWKTANPPCLSTKLIVSYNEMPKRAVCICCSLYAYLWNHKTQKHSEEKGHNDNLLQSTLSISFIACVSKMRWIRGCMRMCVCIFSLLMIFYLQINERFNHIDMSVESLFHSHKLHQTKNETKPFSSWISCF